MTEPLIAENVKGKGRHYRDPRSGDLVPSVTNVIGILDKPAIPRWSARVVAETAWSMRASLHELGEDEAIDLLKGSPWRKSNRAATRGTSVHDLLERRTRGEEGFELIGEAAAYADGVDAFLADHDVVPWHTEVTMFGDGYAGTADLIGLLDGIPVLLDYKTGKNGPYDEVALQITALRQCPILVVDGEIREAPILDDGVAVLIKPGGKYVIKRVADPEGAHAAFRALLDAWHWHRGTGAKLGAWDPPAAVDVELGDGGPVVRFAS